MIPNCFVLYATYSEFDEKKLNHKNDGADTVG
jgi:hypothetical protein